MNKEKFVCFILCFLFLLYSCDLLRDSPYEVEAWTPGEGFQNDPGKIKVSLLLSLESDKTKTEQAFSLTEDGRALKGKFSWEEYRLVFSPASPLEAGRDYVISLGTGAQDVKGLSLENNFEVSFTTRRSGGKPRITGAEPGHGGIVLGSRGEFSLFFSEAVSLDSCRDSVSFSPSTPGSWRLENGDKTACFIPREPWQAGSLYRVKVGSNFSAASGLKLGTDYLTHFSAGDDGESPVLLKVLALNPGKEDEEISLEKPGVRGGGEYGEWESFTRLCLVFSEAVDTGGLKNYLAAEPDTALVMESPPEMSARAVFRLDESAWGNSFLLRLRPGIKDRAGNESVEEYAFRIKTAGPFSKPPALAGIRLPMAPGKPENRKLVSFSPADIFKTLPMERGEGRYPFGEKIPSWVELYFECSGGTEIDLFSVMDLFRVESTNQALTFYPESIRKEDFTVTSPAEEWKKLRRLEVRGFFTNTVHSGVVTFRIPPGLADKRGNRSADDFRVSLLK